MVFHLLPLRRRRAKQRASGIDQIFALFIVFFVYQEIFLLAADGRAQGVDILVAKQFQDAQALAVDGLHAAQQRRLLVQRMAGIRTECRRDAEHIVLDKRIRSRVPGRIAAGLKRRAQTAIRERRRVRFTTDQFFAGKLHHDLAMTIRYDEAVVFFCRYAGQRLEPVREVGRSFLQRPLLHRVGDRIGDLGIQAAAITDGLLQLFKCVFGQTLTHLLFVEYHGSKQFANSCLHRFSLSLFNKKTAETDTYPKVHDAFAVFMCAVEEIPSRRAEVNISPVLCLVLCTRFFGLSSTSCKKFQQIETSFTFPVPSGNHTVR